MDNLSASLHTLPERLFSRQAKIAVTGLGYVGLPLACRLAEHCEVIAYDCNEAKLTQLKSGHDPAGEVDAVMLGNPALHLTCDPEDLRQASFHIIAVPTPVNEDNTPDLTPLIAASRSLAPYLTPGAVVCFESTVYPGVTEEVCLPELEKGSGLVCGRDFSLGYSPERINPGDKQHRLDNTVKIVSGRDAATLDAVDKVYSSVVHAGVYRAPDIRTAEAAKVIENCQRDINIAFMNELSIIFHRLGLDTREVLKAAGTKWNFLPFKPGLVGGHCIGVDPYYLAYQAEMTGYHSQIILSGRRINDDMAHYVVTNLLKLMIKASLPVKGSKVGILGLTFKEDCPDLRNSKVLEIVTELKDYGIELVLHDAQADAAELNSAHSLDLTPLEDFRDLDALILAVPHQRYRALTQPDFKAMFRCADDPERSILLDLKGVLPSGFESAFTLWRL